MKVTFMVWLHTFIYCLVFKNYKAFFILSGYTTTTTKICRRRNSACCFVRTVWRCLWEFHLLADKLNLIQDQFLDLRMPLGRFWSFSCLEKNGAESPDVVFDNLTVTNIFLVQMIHLETAVCKRPWRQRKRRQADSHWGGGASSSRQAELLPPPVMSQTVFSSGSSADGPRRRHRLTSLRPRLTFWQHSVEGFQSVNCII